jgi:hypothetical protein
MFTSAALGLALESLVKCVSNLTFYTTHAPNPVALSEEWAAAERHNVIDHAIHAANLAVKFDDQRAAAEGRIQVIMPALAGEIDDARRRALSLITLLSSRKDLATSYYDKWPVGYQQDVDDLRALNERLRREGRRLMAESAPVAVTVESPRPECVAEPSAASAVRTSPPADLALMRAPLIGHWATASELAAYVGQPAKRVDTFLRRYHDKHPDCRRDNEQLDPDGRIMADPRFEYRTRDVLPPLRERVAKWRRDLTND